MSPFRIIKRFDVIEELSSGIVDVLGKLGKSFLFDRCPQGTIRGTNSGCPKIDQYWLAFLCKQDIVRLDVQMYDVIPV